MLFSPKMEDNEVIFIHGAERFSKYVGYGGRFKFAGRYNDQTPRYN
jgi:poly(ADP-ribose) glycohydrolase